MNHELHAQMKKIIAQSYSDDKERQRAEKIFYHLAEHQEKFLEDLKRRLELESVENDWEENFTVATKLVRVGNLEEMRGFYPVNVGSSFLLDGAEENPFAQKQKLPQRAFFLDCPYDQQENFLERTFEGKLERADGSTKNFSYELRRHERFIAQEKILYKTAQMYGIRRPIIFSPYARSAVDLKTADLDAEDLLQAKKFSLNDKILTDRQLVWNVQIEDADLTEREEFIGADDRLTRYEYFYPFDVPKSFILPAQHCDDLTRQTLDDGSQRILLGYNSVLKERTAKILTFSTFDSAAENIFINDFPRKNNKLRLRSAADIEKVLACFNATRFGKIFPAKFFGFGSRGIARPLKIYRREDRYFAAKESRLLSALRNKPPCFVAFEGADEKFKIDYANYVLYYLSQNYPEFGWAGVES